MVKQVNSKRIYLDYASATPLDSRVLKEMSPFWSDIFYNASATYSDGRLAKSELDTARQKVAKILGARPPEIIFTSGGSESNNLAINGIMSLHPGCNCLVLAVEHDSVIKPANNYQHKLIAVDEVGRINLTNLQKSIDDKTVLVSVQFANNEIGTIQPLKDISEIIKTVNHQRQKAGLDLPLYFHSDACQAVNYLDTNVNRLGVDLMSLNGGKMYGPKGSGMLFIKTGTKLKSLIEGGGQEFNLRSGTENLAMAIGFASALEITTAKRQSESKRMLELTKLFTELLQEHKIKYTLNGPKNNRLPNNLHLAFDGVDNERLLIRLDLAGVSASAGSACSASSSEPSHVLSAIGQTEAQAKSSIRFSFGRQTTPAELKIAVKKLALALDKEH